MTARALVGWGMALALAGCAQGRAGEDAAASPGADVAREAALAAETEAPDVVDVTEDLVVDVGGEIADATADAAALDAAVIDDRAAVTDAAGDAMPSGFAPTSLRVETVFEGPSGVLTPASWNPHLPKLVGDGAHWYAVHTHYPDDVAGRFAVIARRGADGGAWSEVARLRYVHQPPGAVMDRERRMHLTFDCLRVGGAETTCFAGGAGTAGVASRFYHLIFAGRAADGALRFDTYLNYNEWTAHADGYQGLSVASDGPVVWSHLDATGRRVVQYWIDATRFGTLAPLARDGVQFLYPVIAPHPVRGSASVLHFVGDFDRNGGTNAGYLAATLHGGDLSAVREVQRFAPTTPPARGAIGAFPSDLVYDARGVAYALVYLPNGRECTELRRFDAGLDAPPTRASVGCVGTYASLQFSRDGTLYLFDPAVGRSLRVGVSVDRGDSWRWVTVPFDGATHRDDLRFEGYTLVRPTNAPGVFDADRAVFFFTGIAVDNTSRRSYFGVLRLAP